jgi:hypothetical protein
LDAIDVLHPVDKANVVGHFGCLVVETVISASLVALVAVPGYFLLR